MTSLTITITDPRVVDGFVEAANRNGVAPEAIVLEFLGTQGRAYADLFGIGVITSAAFIARFTPQEYAGILAAAETNESVASLMATLLAEPFVRFDDPRLEPGLQELVASELLEAARVEVLLAYDRPAVPQ